MSTFGTLFKVSTFGESHGVGVGCVVDGVPPNLPLTEADIQPQLTRRRPGQSSIVTPRSESDLVTILSGTENGLTLGTPIGMLVKNQNQKKFDYANTAQAPRPGHADYTYQVKYGTRASSGGGRASARETISRVAAGALADKWLLQEHGTKVVCWVNSVMDIDIPKDAQRALEQNPPSREEIDSEGTLAEDDKFDHFVDRHGQKYSRTDGAPLGPAGSSDLQFHDGKMIFTRCPHAPTAARMAARIHELRKKDDSTGGICTCVVTGMPIGLGEPCFDKLEAEMAKAMMSLPATKGFEVGEGFNCGRMLGSDHNDCFTKAGNDGLLKCRTNHAGGTLGGISTGEHLVMRIAIKPASSISQDQETCTFDGEPHTLSVKGRHDPCVLPRAPPLVEGMASMVLMDAALRQRARSGSSLKTLDEPPTKVARM
mmetsp:Transcript_89956/g.196912  ORF Transcript_89956/g.196912 Transcript_89956/m.196912 type:complete len:427 (-) Transcript_89956:319-1599(-)